MNTYSVFIPIIPKPGTFRAQKIVTIKAETEEEALELGWKKITNLGYIFDPTPESSDASFAILHGSDKSYPIYKDLWEVLPKEMDQPECCSDNYGKWEEIVIPILEKLGYTNIGYFMNGETDRFGPLSRKIRVCKDNVWYFLIYG